MGIKYIVLHPGSSVKHSKEEGIKNIIEALNKLSCIAREENSFVDSYIENVIVDHDYIFEYVSQFDY